MRKTVEKQITDTTYFKKQLLQWVNQYKEVVYLDSNNHKNNHTVYDCLVAIEAFTCIKTDSHNAFKDLNDYQKITKDWLFGYLSYDLKNDVENVTSTNLDELQFPELFFFQPKKIISIQNNKVSFSYLLLCEEEINEDYQNITNTQLIQPKHEKVNLQQRINKQNYLEKVSAIQKQIQQGVIYEANFCMEFFSENSIINPLSVYQSLTAISTPPFSVYLKNNNHYLLSASPERYLQKRETTVISQPIKGTAKRGKNKEQDRALKEKLKNNPKEKAENIMIVDLVRNDLSKTATKGSVTVTELCKIYTFEQVHQMISTIQSTVLPTTSPVEILQTTFPMGSMTGAPKKSAIEIIEQQEVTKRSLYSGAVGYFTPTGNFDFNVVIRSILYNKQKKYLSFSVGSAITINAIAEDEYKECLVKAKAMLQVLQ